MDFAFNETHLMIRETARKFAEEVLAPSADERDEKEEFPREAVRQMGELGFMGMMVSEQYGGAGLDTISYVTAMEEISKVDASAGVIMSVNNSLVCWGIESYGSEEQRQKYLKDLASGKKLGAFALSEPEAGSDATNQRTTAVRDGADYILNGTKNWITNGLSSDVVLVMAATDRTKGPKGVSAFILEKGMPGFTVGKKERKLGIRSSDTVSLMFQDVRVPVANRIGEEGSGIKFALKTLDGGRIGIAAQALGIAQACLEASIAYSKERKAFDQPIGHLQAIQFKIADMATNIAAARWLTLDAAVRKDKNERYGQVAAMAKLYASKVAVQSALEAIQIHGGYGYVREYKVERFLRDAKITEIYEGTSEIQRIVIARGLLG
ncbi:MAG: acyl-CoA dehydrogenase [Ignavibacteria bacterium GWA2_55_11]|nr:MAG: acyl-CoA dehydrogenase [Ignavibacteria bacterium GWA2_55_11]OGU43861.1 MAG: acyl-CoA dehydrogenase [Ignavibacteria bacterium GWC2_56_12]OGU63599.1 MAG: acyl-CoA dehydrogenase [Ignavibacteria bacterium RIFCSPHIGHO2_02_FULL_56_12]OGU73148.1 MAG: acyl-CoA dehydrogenase [Ignavibacteria bacterium RIFCSPLOWO2_12_FULL_56_21]HAV23452.1 acyl-CoA dehydrogenase [Bacteroidota bacterium]